MNLLILMGVIVNLILIIIIYLQWKGIKIQNYFQRRRDIKNKQLENKIQKIVINYLKTLQK